jgi:ABC-type antimicrobial peptide transport system permease subunit
LSTEKGEQENPLGLRRNIGILKEALILVLAGAAIGIPASLGLARMASSQISELLFGPTIGDSSVIASAAALLMLATFLATFLPALRASRVDPMAALRDE